jgi:hypothetical protein
LQAVARVAHDQAFDHHVGGGDADGVAWREVESLLKHVGADIEPSHGARFRVLLNKHEFFLHHPHHSNEFGKQEIKHLRECLAGAGVTPSAYEEQGG